MKSIFIYFLISITPILSIGQKQYKYEKNIVVIRDTSIYRNQINNRVENKLIDIKDVIPDIKLDIRYATTNNFVGEVIYPSPVAFARLPVVDALVIVQESLRKRGLGLVIFDAYRPYSATVKFYEVYKDTNYVASPYGGSRHNRGAAVDVSLVDLATGEEIQMPTAYDSFTEAAHPDYTNLPENVIVNREILINEMQNHGFKVYPTEWWHFDFIGWEAYDIMDISFEDLSKHKF